MKLKVSAVVELRPLKLFIVSDESLRGLVGIGNRNVLSIGRGGSECSPGKFNTNGTSAGLGIVRLVVDPSHIAHPVGMRITRNHDVVVDLVVVEGLECAVLVGQISIPGVDVQRVLAVGNGLIEARED